MKLRVEIAPPAGAGLTMVIFGTEALGDIAEVHHRPGLQADRLEPRLQRRVRLQLLAALVAGDADVGGAHDHAGHAVVDQRHSTPSITSTSLPVGSSAPQVEPAVSRNSIGTAAACPARRRSAPCRHS